MVNDGTAATHKKKGLKKQFPLVLLLCPPAVPPNQFTDNVNFTTINQLSSWSTLP
jgi:hypothetical protein